MSILRRMESKHRQEFKIPTYKRPSRRGPTPPYMGRVKRNSLQIWWLQDTSGSMGRDVLCLPDPELKGIVRRGAEIWVFHVDGGIAKKELYHPRRGLNAFYGRGGTEFSDPFLELLKTSPKHKPGFVIYYTDGYGGLDQGWEEEVSIEDIK